MEGGGHIRRARKGGQRLGLERGDRRAVLPSGARLHGLRVPRAPLRREDAHADQRDQGRGDAARQLVEPLTQALERDGSTRAYFDIDLPLVAVLSIMERTGTALDCDRLAELGASTEDELAGLAARMGVCHGPAAH